MNRILFIRIIAELVFCSAIILACIFGKKPESFLFLFGGLLMACFLWVVTDYRPKNKVKLKLPIGKILYILFCIVFSTIVLVLISYAWFGSV